MFLPNEISTIAVYLKNNPSLVKKLTKTLGNEMNRDTYSFEAKMAPYVILNTALSSKLNLKQLFAIVDEFIIEQASETSSTRTKPERRIRIVEQLIPDQYQCPITQEPIKEPVPVMMNSNRDIRYYERDSLLRWLHQNPSNPLSREPLYYKDVEKIEVDREHQHKIQQWLEDHPDACSTTRD